MLTTSNRLADLKYCSKEFPTIVVNDGSIQTLPEAVAWVSSNQAALKKELGSTGAILLRGFPISDADSYDAFFAAFGYGTFTYQESLSNAVRINHTERVFSANEAPKDVEIFIHNEMAQTPLFPDVISLFCETAAQHGGATILCRSDDLYQQLLKAEPAATLHLEDTGIKYTTRMPDQNSPESGQGRSWRGTLSVETTAQAEQKLAAMGYSWQWSPAGELQVQSPALPAIRTLEGGRKVFFNQIIAAYMGWKGVKENPTHALCFGDGSDINKRYLDTIVEVAAALSYDLQWENGDVAVVHNHLAMHGRRPYSGLRKRKVLVVLGRNEAL